MYFDSDKLEQGFKNSLVFDCRIDWKSNYRNNLSLINNYIQLEYNSDNANPELAYIINVDPTNDPNNSIEVLNKNYMFYAQIWFYKSYIEYLEHSNLIGMESTNQLIVLESIHYDNNEQLVIDNYIDVIRLMEGRDITNSELSTYFMPSYIEAYAIKRRKLFDRLKINTFEEIKEIYKFHLRIEKKIGYRNLKTVRELNRVYRDIKNGKPF